MKLDLFHHFKSAGDYVTSSAARAQLKAWDQRYELDLEEDYPWEEWEEELRQDRLDGCDILKECGILLDEKLEIMVNPRLTVDEMWLHAINDHNFGGDYADDYDPWGDYDPWDDYDPYYDYDPFREYDYEFPYERMMEEADSPPHVFFLHELEKESEKYIEDCKVWNQTMQEIAQFEERPCTPEPDPRITNHHYRKAA